MVVACEMMGLTVSVNASVIEHLGGAVLIVVFFFPLDLRYRPWIGVTQFALLLWQECVFLVCVTR